MQHARRNTVSLEDSAALTQRRLCGPVEINNTSLPSRKRNRLSRHEAIRLIKEVRRGVTRQSGTTPPPENQLPSV